MTAHEISVRIAEYAGSIGALLGQLEEALRDHSERAKEIPAVEARLERARQELAQVESQLAARQAELTTVQTARDELLRRLGVLSQ